MATSIGSLFATKQLDDLTNSNRWTVIEQVQMTIELVNVHVCRAIHVSNA
jgi:hypothetical protein